MSGARDVVLDAPARLVERGRSLDAVGALPQSRAAFAGARRACLVLDLLRRAGRPVVGREETLEASRVPEVDALGVVVATPRPPGDDGEPARPPYPRRSGNRVLRGSSRGRR